MSQVASFDPSERLPWLSDPARPQPRQPRRSWYPLVIALSAAGAIAFGGWTMVERSRSLELAPTAPAERVALPPPKAPVRSDPRPQAAVKPQPPSTGEREALRPMAAPAGERTIARQDRSSTPRQARESAATANRQSVAATERRAAKSARPAILPRARSVAVTPPTSQPPRLWPSHQVAGAGGRLVQIGAFGTRQQAKLGWRRMQRSYPAIGRLPAVVVEARNSRGRKFYRFQIGTTSHAHSEVLCQRMQRMDYSCAVIGLAWKAKVER